MLKPLILLISINIGGWIGWICGSPAGLMTAYFAAVLGASIGLYIGRRIQRNLGDD